MNISRIVTIYEAQLLGGKMEVVAVRKGRFHGYGVDTIYDNTLGSCQTTAAIIEDLRDGSVAMVALNLIKFDPEAVSVKIGEWVDTSVLRRERLEK